MNLNANDEIDEDVKEILYPHKRGLNLIKFTKNSKPIQILRKRPKVRDV
jgi:hypothetical protein